METAKGFLEIAKYLAGRPPYPFEINPSSSPADLQKIKDDHVKWRAMTCHMLHSIVFEIAIKVIWTLDKQASVRPTHNITELFEELSRKSQQQIERVYRKESIAFPRLAEKIFTQLGEVIHFQSLKEALTANEDTMKNFKYRHQFKGKSSILGSVIWGKENFWVLPYLEGARFPEALYLYVENRIEKASCYQASIGESS